MAIGLVFYAVTCYDDDDDDDCGNCDDENGGCEVSQRWTNR